MKRSPLPIAPTLPGVPCTYRVGVRTTNGEWSDAWVPGTVIESKNLDGVLYHRVRSAAYELAWRNADSVRVEGQS